MKPCLPLLVILLINWPVRAGLHYSAEVQGELPAQWRGFLLDHRALRMIAIAPTNSSPTLLREQYLAAAAKLTKLATQRDLSSDEAADLGALQVRLGAPVKAVEVLRAAQRKNSEHFRIAANLGTAWQIQGDLEESARALREAVRLAPAKWKTAEEYHLKLVQRRARESKNATSLDDLFGVPYLGASGKPEPGKVAADERMKLPPDAPAIVQQIALWLPADGRLLWQLGEIANAHGDVRTAANILDGCVTEFTLASPDLRKRRAIYREAADEIAKLPDDQHDKYRGDLKMKSPRPLLKKLDSSILPAIRADGVNALPWIVLTETTIGRPFKPKFAKYLDDLDGKRAGMTGFMFPLGTDTAEISAFMLVEYPIGCWFCETPDPTGIVFVSLPDGKTTSLKKGLIKIDGTFRLNRTDPEQYLQSLRNAQVGEPD
jgi:tetratricopeptide (TPR) repeat protein